MGLRSQGWVSVKDADWQECELVDSSDTQLTLQLKDGTHKFDRSKTAFHLRNPKELEAAEDFLTLPNLDEPNILHSLRVRYWKGIVYSYTGAILLAVNPWQRVGIYERKHLEAHVKSGVSKEAGPGSPHIFAVAAKAYRAMLAERKDQCVLISGESGAGKTESTKYVLQVLTAIGGSGGSSGVEEQVLQSNPVLEAFGNAKTLRNDNSSRFGKWIEVVFSGSKICGAAVRTYLLEKSRVVTQAAGERNYHIFYQCCAAARSGDAFLSDLGLDDASEFASTRTCCQAGNRDDGQGFAETKAAMDKLGMSETGQRSLLRVVAATLHLSNIEMGEEIDWDGNSVATVGLQDRSLKLAAEVLEVSAAALKEGLCTRRIESGKEAMSKPETRANALLCRDSLCKTLYATMFDRLVALVNTAMGGHEGAGKAGHGGMKVAVLDIFGFESFAVNRFEQLCINHANEKLQQHFNHYSFIQEQALLSAEGIEVAESEFVDNSGCVALLEDAWGIQSILDDVCKMPKGDDAVLLQRLAGSKEVKESNYYQTPRKRDGTFIVKHYAGAVAYTAGGFCERNKDVLPTSAVALMQGSKNAFFAGLFDDLGGADGGGNGAAVGAGVGGGRASGPGGKGGKGKKLSVSGRFKGDLVSLSLSFASAAHAFKSMIGLRA